MKPYSIHEWGRLPITEEGEGPSRAEADALAAAAARSPLGGRDGEAILTNGHTQLRVQQVVGVLRAPQASLEILPKIDGLGDRDTRCQLVRMLAAVLDFEIDGRELADLGRQTHDLLELVIALFTRRLLDQVRRGLSRRYVGFEEDLPILRGRLDAVRQFTVLAASPQRLACRHDDLSPDIVLNRIMRAAVDHLRRVARTPDNQRRLAELVFAFADVSSLPPAAIPWDSVVLDRTNRVWTTLFELARLLLLGHHQNTGHGADTGFALLFEMNTLFEAYIARKICPAVAGTGLQVLAQNPKGFALRDEAGRGRFQTIPDVALMQGRDAAAIIDTKWKRLDTTDACLGVSSADVYQMMAYAQIYRCNRLMLLYPHHDALGSPGVLRRYRIGKTSAELVIATVDLRDNQIEAFISFLLGPLLEAETAVA